MGPENSFRAGFIRNVRASVDKAREAKTLDHNALAGAVREIAAQDILRPVLPPEAQIGTGRLVSFSGEASPQIDVVLYAPSILPPLLYDRKLGLFPVESCLYCVEVKSTLTATELKHSIDSARATSQLPVIAGEHWQLVDGTRQRKETMARPIGALFAFDSDLSAGDLAELDRYRKYDKNADTEPAISVICVVGRGYWYSVSEGGWRFVRPSADLNEVMSFLGGLTNTIPELMFAKGRPRFGNYLCAGAIHYGEAAPQN